MRLPNALENSALVQGSSTWRRGLEKPFLILADVVALTVAALTWQPNLAYELSHLSTTTLQSAHPLPDSLFILLLVSAVAVSIFWLRGHYSRRIPFWNEVRQVLKYTLFLALLDVSVLFDSCLW